jgi:hypothetical protein
MTFVNWFLLSVTIATATSLLLSRDWRWGLGFLAAQYIGMFWLVQSHWPISMAAVKLVTGWMACAILGIAQLNIHREESRETTWLQGRLFRFLAAGMVLAVSYALSLKIVPWLNLDLVVAWGGLALIGLGLLHLGISSEAFRVILALLTVMAGFEVLYASVESSILVAALLVIVNLGLAMAGAYFLVEARSEVP